MRIYGDTTSGNCLKVKYTADKLGQPYEWLEVSALSGETRTAAFTKLSPKAKIPVVDFGGGRVLAESNAIIRYLAHGTPLLPEDVWQQAKVDEWLFWEQYSHEPYIAVCRFHMFYLGKPKQDREAWRVERGETALDLLDEHLSTRTWVTDAGFTVADVALLAYTRLAADGGFDLDSRASVQAWIARCEAELDLAPVQASAQAH
jgi:glutathione S-transferase